MSELITSMDAARRYLSSDLDAWRPDRQHAASYAARNPTPTFALAAPAAMDREPLQDVFLPRLLVRACRELYGKDWQFWPQFQADGTCFAAGAQVLMADGSRRAISAVDRGDMVISHTGNEREVLETKSRQHTGEMVSLGMYGSSRTLSATASHPVLIRRQLRMEGGKQVMGQAVWMSMDRVKVGDYILVPYRAQHACKPLTEEVVAAAVKPDRYIDPSLVEDGETKRAIRTYQLLVPRVGVFTDETGYMVRVKSTHKSKVRDLKVFNIEVEEDHSYTVDGFGVHNCVGQSHKVLIDILAAANRYVTGAKFLGRASVAAIYAMSRVEIGRNPGYWQGSNGSWAAEAAEKGAYLLLEEAGLDPNPKTKKAFYEMTRQDELLALKWAASSSGVPSEFESMANHRPVQGAANVSTIEEVRASLSDLKPVNLCGKVHPAQNRQNGVSVNISGGGGHSTFLVGQFYDKRQGRWYYDHMQSWGDYYTGDYARRDSAYKEDLMFATCTTRIPEEWVRRWLGQRDCYSIFGLNGVDPVDDAFRILSVGS